MYKNNIFIYIWLFLIFWFAIWKSWVHKINPHHLNMMVKIITLLKICMNMINHILQIMDVRKHIQKLYKKEIFKVLLIYIIKKQKKDLNYNKQWKEIKRKLYVSHKNGLKEIFQNFWQLNYLTKKNYLFKKYKNYPI